MCLFWDEVEEPNYHIFVTYMKGLTQLHPTLHNNHLPCARPAPSPTLSLSPGSPTARLEDDLQSPSPPFLLELFHSV